jgi:RHS repeat-associated protein
MGTAKGFTGQYQDATGLDYYNARYYDPVVGRFLSADTVQGNSGGLDPYAYVQDNPETHNDPTGHCGLPCLIAFLILYGISFILINGSAVYILYAPPPGNGPTYPPGSPQPEPAPTAGPTPESTPSTDTNGAGARCQSARCYNLIADEDGTNHSYTAANGHTYIGHTIRDHVNISDADLRIEADKTAKQGGVGRASKFTDLDTAMWAVQYAFDHMSATDQQRYQAFLSADVKGSTLDFMVDTGEIIGYGYYKGGSVKIDVSVVSVSLMIDSNGQVFVLSAYPYLPRLPKAWDPSVCSPKAPCSSSTA